MPGMKTLVFSRTLEQGKYPDVTVVANAARDEIAKLHLGKGIQLAPSLAKPTKLVLTNHKLYKTGIVALEYACA
jgi:hypothetical protein